MPWVQSIRKSERSLTHTKFQATVDKVLKMFGNFSALHPQLCGHTVSGFCFTIATHGFHAWDHSRLYFVSGMIFFLYFFHYIFISLSHSLLWELLCRILRLLITVCACVLCSGSYAVCRDYTSRLPGSGGFSSVVAYQTPLLSFSLMRFCSRERSTAAVDVIRFVSRMRTTLFRYKCHFIRTHSINADRVWWICEYYEIVLCVWMLYGWAHTTFIFAVLYFN